MLDAPYMPLLRLASKFICIALPPSLPPVEVLPLAVLYNAPVLTFGLNAPFALVLFKFVAPIIFGKPGVTTPMLSLPYTAKI